MVTYRIVSTEVGGQPAYYVVVQESGAVVGGPYRSRGAAITEANGRAALLPGHRVQS